MNKNFDAEEYYQQGRGLFDNGQYDKSLVLCKRAITTQSDHYIAHFYWSRNLSSKSIYHKSIKKHKELISRDPIDSDAYHNLALAYEKQGQIFEAETQYKKAISINRSFYSSCLNLAIVLTKQAKYTEALEQYEENIRSNPNDSLNHNSYGYLKFILGDYGEAIKSYEEAARKTPNYSLPFINKSLALYCLGRSELAVEAFKESLDKVAENEDWKTRFEKNLGIYEGELKRFEGTLESGDLGEILRETLERNIKALGIIVDSLKQVLLEKSVDQENKNE